MRHVILLLILSLCCYFGWRLGPVSMRNRVRSALKNHFLVVTLIVLVCFIGLGIQFSLHSTRIL